MFQLLLLSHSMSQILSMAVIGREGLGPIDPCVFHVQGVAFSRPPRPRTRATRPAFVGPYREPYFSFPGCPFRLSRKVKEPSLRASFNTSQVPKWNRGLFHSHENQSFFSVTVSHAIFSAKVCHGKFEMCDTAFLGVCDTAFNP